jgi:protein-glutamine gamma-glutamyltransferase
MDFEKFFRLVSYAAVFCGFFSLWVSGTFGVLATGLFLAVFVGAWFLEGSRWQIGEKTGTALIVLALPLFYGAWYLQMIPATGGETWIAGMLARMILCLAAIKLLQKKSDRDWIFLYLMAFFEVLLAAGLSISALYLLSFLTYLLVMACAIIAFEIRKTSRLVERKIAGTTAKKEDEVSESNMVMRVRRLPITAVALIIFVVVLALPLFFLLPRVGGAGFGGDQRGLSTQSGFSDRVTLGQFGTIQMNDSVVMRVKLENGSENPNGLYFRGVALDTFDNKAWSKSKNGQQRVRTGGDRDMVVLNEPVIRDSLFIQTIYLEPLDTPVLFALPRAVSIQGSFPFLTSDDYGAVNHARTSERVSYKAFSDRSVPSAATLRLDDLPYSTEVQNYRSLPPVYDLKIAELAARITEGSKNRYDKAKAVESYLQTSYGYTLEQKASGRQPLSDFLFNIREGHCEYFATAMAIMLRTQGVATRIVNGFHGGEYNDAVDMTIVRQRNAHAWVEVYFPKEDAWVTFDPTPFAGQSGGGSTSGIAASFNKYVEALETFWIQYFVAFDNQEQQSLARTVRTGFVDYQARIASYLGVTRDIFSEWLAEVRGDKGIQASLVAVGYAIGYIVAVVIGVLLAIWLFRKVSRLKVWPLLWDRLFSKRHSSIVEFYDRMLAILATRGFTREPFQTPLEFAYSLEIPEALAITQKYNSVRFGEQSLSRSEEDEIEVLLEQIEER